MVNDTVIVHEQTSFERDLNPSAMRGSNSETSNVKSTARPILQPIQQNETKESLTMKLKHDSVKKLLMSCCSRRRSPMRNNCKGKKG